MPLSSISGAEIYGGQTTSGSASGNTVDITSGTYSSSIISGAYSTSGSVTNNTVTINSGDFDGTSNISGGHSISGTVTDNHLIINGGDFQTGSVLSAGYADTVGTNVHGNTMTITGGDLGGATLSGGSNSTAAHDHTAVLRTNNTLVLKANTTAGTVKNFEHFEFFMADSHATTPMLTATNLHLGDDANLRVYLGNKADNLQTGEKIHVFNTTNTIQGNVGSGVALQGLSVVNHLEYVPNATNHFYTITGQSAHPHSITFPEARLASFAFMNQADDLLAGQGIASAIDATTMRPREWTVFGAAAIGTSEYNTDEGATGDVQFGGLSLVTGLSKAMPLGNASVLAGAYFEAGTGFIDVDNDNNGLSSVNTGGDTNYYGLGMFGRYTKNGIYGVAFIRDGLLDTDFKTQDNKNSLEYDATTAYFGAGVNFGYQLKLLEARDMLDIYTRYMWTHLVEKDMALDSQDYHFDAINSHQVRVGAQYNFMHSSVFSPFVGIAGQYEFDGESRADIRNVLEIKRPDITGFTGLAELGIRVLPSVDSPVTTSMNFEAYIGAREGVSVTLDIGYSF